MAESQLFILCTLRIYIDPVINVDGRNGRTRKLPGSDSR